jgi:hypothetical protein
LKENSPVMNGLLGANPNWYCRPLREQFGIEI